MLDVAVHPLSGSGPSALLHPRTSTALVPSARRRPPRRPCSSRGGGTRPSRVPVTCAAITAARAHPGSGPVTTRQRCRRPGPASSRRPAAQLRSGRGPRPRRRDPASDRGLRRGQPRGDAPAPRDGGLPRHGARAPPLNRRAGRTADGRPHRQACDGQAEAAPTTAATARGPARVACESGTRQRRAGRARSRPAAASAATEPKPASGDQPAPVGSAAARRAVAGVRPPRPAHEASCARAGAHRCVGAAAAGGSTMPGSGSCRPTGCARAAGGGGGTSGSTSPMPEVVLAGHPVPVGVQPLRITGVRPQCRLRRGLAREVLGSPVGRRPGCADAPPASANVPAAARTAAASRFGMCIDCWSRVSAHPDAHARRPQSTPSRGRPQSIPRSSRGPVCYRLDGARCRCRVAGCSQHPRVRSPPAPDQEDCNACRSTPAPAPPPARGPRRRRRRCWPPTTTGIRTRRTPPSGSRSAPPGTAAPRSTTTFNDDHIAATSQAICEYRARAGHRRPAVPRPRHARAVRAGLGHRGRGVRGQRRARCWSTRPTASPRPRRCRTRSCAQPRPHRAAWPTASSSPRRTTRRRDGGFKYNPPQRRPGRHRRHHVDRQPGQRAARRASWTGCSGARSSRARRRSGRYDFLGEYVATCPVVLNMDAIRDAGVRIGADPLGGASVAYWGAIAERLRARSDRGQPGRRPAVRVHDAGLGRQDPDGLLVAVRDGLAGVRRGTASPISTGNDADADRHGIVTADAADEPQPLPGRGHRLPVREPPGLAAATPASARRPSARR